MRKDFHIAHGLADWVVGVEPFDAEQFGVSQEGIEMPDMSIDPESKMLTVFNTWARDEKCVHISVSAKYRAYDRDGRPLQSGTTRDDDGNEEER